MLHAYDGVGHFFGDRGSPLRQNIMGVMTQFLIQLGYIERGKRHENSGFDAAGGFLAAVQGAL